MFCRKVDAALVENKSFAFNPTSNLPGKIQLPGKIEHHRAGQTKAETTMTISLP
jgi:hypothetical protein